MHLGSGDHEDLKIHGHILQLEILMNYLMSENQFFRCLQVEVYLYFASIYIFFVLVKQTLLKSIDEYPKLANSIEPFLVLYVIFLIKYVNKLRNKIDVNRSSVCLAAICCYLLFIVTARY